MHSVADLMPSAVAMEVKIAENTCSHGCAHHVHVEPTKEATEVIPANSEKVGSPRGCEAPIPPEITATPAAAQITPTPQQVLERGPSTKGHKCSHDGHAHSPQGAQGVPSKEKHVCSHHHDHKPGLDEACFQGLKNLFSRIAQWLRQQYKFLHGKVKAWKSNSKRVEVKKEQ